VESDLSTGETFLGRLNARIDEVVDSGELAVPVGLSAGVTRYRTTATTPLIYCQNDLGGAWERDHLGNWRHECLPGGESQRFQSFMLGSTS